MTYLRSLAIDEPFVRQTSTGNEYYHADGLGSTVVLSDDAGTTTTTYIYDPFGKANVTGSSSNSLQFTARENDGTGLYYYRARYYSPQFHRFFSEDPIGLEGGDENFYAYTFNSPTNFTDPSGTIGIGGCLIGIGVDLVLSGRKPTLSSVVGSCALGAIGGMAGKTALKGLGNLSSRLGKGRDRLVLGRRDGLGDVAKKEGGRLSDTRSEIAKEIYKKNSSDIRKADEIIFVEKNVPKSLQEALDNGGGQFSRAERELILSRPELTAKTIFK